MTTYPNLNNDPDLLRIKTKDDGNEKLKYQTENIDHENILKSLKIDKKCYKKKYEKLNKEKKL